MPPVIVSVVNFKGGVGKTTLAAVLATTLAVKLNRRVLVIDMDPQANITEVFIDNATLARLEEIAGRNNLRFSLEWAMEERSEPLVYDVGRGVELKIIPSHPSHLKLVRQIAGMPAQRMRLLRQELLTRFREFDYIFIDFPPQMYQIVESAFHMTDFIISPVTDTPFAIESIRFLIENLSAVNVPPTHLLGVVLTRFMPNESRKIADYREKVSKIILRAYRVIGSKWPFENLFAPVFETPFYAARIWSNLRALPSKFGGVRLLRILQGRWREVVSSERTRMRYERAISNAVELAREFEDRVKMAIEASRR